MSTPINQYYTLNLGSIQVKHTRQSCYRVCLFCSSLTNQFLSFFKHFIEPARALTLFRVIE